MTDRPAGAAGMRVDRPAIPPEYGTAKATDFLDWTVLERRLSDARVYWLATVGPTGRPRVRPIDGLFLDGILYVGGSPETRWVRELAANPYVAVHLDGVDDVLVLDGVAEILRSVDEALAERLAAASNEKFPEYDMTPAVYRARGAIAIRPRKVVAWTDISRNPTRILFDAR
jgi:hypothetical protein